MTELSDFELQALDMAPTSIAVIRLVERVRPDQVEALRSQWVDLFTLHNQVAPTLVILDETVELEQLTAAQLAEAGLMRIPT